MGTQSFRITVLFLVLCLLMISTARPAVSQQTQQLLPLQVLLWDVDITKIVCVIAQEEGIYEKNGLAVEQWITTAAAEGAKRRHVMVPPEHVRDGDWDTAPIVISGGTYMMVHHISNANWIKAERIVLASLDHVVHWHIMARPGIQKLEDLQGKRLGSGPYRSAGMTHFIALAIAERMGWDPLRDISLMGGWGLDELIDGSVDAIVASEVPQVTAMAAGFHSVGDLRSWRVPIAGSGVIARRAWVKENPETVRRFIKSLVEAIAMMKKDRSVANRAIAKWFGITDPEQQRVLYDGNREMPDKPYPAVEGIKKTMQLYDSNEMRRYKPEDFYDDSFVRELDESGFIDSLYR